MGGGCYRTAPYGWRFNNGFVLSNSSKGTPGTLASLRAIPGRGLALARTLDTP